MKSFIIKLFNQIITSSLFKASGIYTLASLLNASIPFLLLPLLTKYLSQSDFGFIAMFTTVTGFIMPFVSLNMEAAVQRRYYSDKENLSEYIGNAIGISSICFIVVLFICLLCKSILVIYTGLPYRWILWGVVYCFSQFFILLLLILYQVKIAPLKYGIIQISQSSLNFLVSILLIVGFGLNWEGRLFAQIISSGLIAVTVIIILVINKQVNFKINYSFIKHAVKFGSGLIPHTLGFSLIVLTNRIFLLKMVGIEETGLFSVASQVASIIGFFTIAFNNAYVPWLFSKLNENNWVVKKKIVKLTYIYFIMISLVGFLFYLSIPLFYRIFINGNFDLSLKYSFWIILGLVFQGMYFMVTNYIIYVEKTFYQAIITIIIGCLNIPINYLCIQLFGEVGAAISFSSCFFLFFIVTWFYSNKVYKMPWNLIFNKEF